MRSFEKILLLFVGIVLLTMGLLSFYFLGQLHDLRKVADLTPQEMSLAELIAKGCGKNAHVRVSDFTFGKPVIEEKEGQWLGAWLPMTPTTKLKKGSSPVIVWAAEVANPEDLQTFMQQTKLDVLCLAQLADTSRLRIRPGKTFRAAQPDVDLAHALILAEPIFVFADGTILDTDVLFDERISEGMGWGGFTALLAGGVCLWMGFRSAKTNSRRGDAKELGRPLPPPPAEAYAELAREPDLSLHPFSWQLVFIRMGLRGGYLVFCMGCIALLLFAVVNAFLTGQLVALVVYVALIVGLFYLGIQLTFMSVGALLQRISGFSVHPSGIRWQEGRKTHSAFWQDIAEVYRAEVRCFRRGEMNNTFSTMKVKLYGGRELYLSADTYAYFEAFVENVGSTHGGWMAAVKRHEFAEHGYATFGYITIHEDGVTLNGRFEPWGEIAKYEIENGHLNFFHSSAMFFTKTSIPFSAIPNVSALLSLLGDLPSVSGRRKMLV